jgi:hypothetical protein
LHIRTLVHKSALPGMDPTGPMFLYCKLAGRYSSVPVVFTTGCTDVASSHSGQTLDDSKVNRASKHDSD